MDETPGPEIKVRRAKLTDATAIASFLSDATHGRITADRAQVQERLGAKGFFLAQTTRIVGLAGMRVENLVARIETILRSLPTGLVASVRVPTLVIDGEASPEVMRRAAQSLADALPDGRYRTLKGQGHDIVPAVVAPVLEEFFSRSNERRFL